MLGGDVPSGQASPDWVSLNLGVFICVECAFIHHTLGAHISTPKSFVTSTECWSPASLQVLRDIGNSRSNALWEYLASIRTKPTPTSTHEIKEQWIYAKYVCHHFIDRYLTRNLNDDPAKYVYNAAGLGSNFDIMRGVAGGGNVRWRIANRGTSALHAAAQRGHVSTCHLLLQLNADPSCVDASDRTALDVAQDHPEVQKFLTEVMQSRRNQTLGRTRSGPHGATNGAAPVAGAAANRYGDDAEAKQPLP